MAWRTPTWTPGSTSSSGIESRGFILGAAVADRLGAGFVPVRKVGKLPSTTVRESYDLEYGSDSLEMHADAIEADRGAHRGRPPGDGRYGAEPSSGWCVNSAARWLGWRS